jgi:hypothetical protein
MSKAIFLGLKAMPLNKDVESNHGESQTGFEIVPSSVRQTFEVANGVSRIAWSL